MVIKIHLPLVFLVFRLFLRAKLYRPEVEKNFSICFWPGSGFAIVSSVFFVVFSDKQCQDGTRV